MNFVEVLNCGVLIAKVFEDKSYEWALEDESVKIGYSPVVDKVVNNFDDFVGKETMIPDPLFTVVKG